MEQYSRLSRRRFLQAAGLAAASAALAACAPPAPSVTADAELRVQPKAQKQGQIQLVYQDWRTDWFPGMAQAMLEEFHAQQPNIRVFFTLDPENLEEKMLADMQAGTAPDVFQGCCSFFPIWAQKDYTLDLRSYVESDLDRETIEDWDPAQYKALFTRDGEQFGLPKYHGALALYYNKDMFEAAGISFPDSSWSHTDYLNAMRRLVQDTDGNGINNIWGSMIDVSWDRIQVHVNGWGGHFVDPEDPTQSLMAEAPALQAMEWLRARMWDDRVMPTRLDIQSMGTRQAFAAGRLAMVEDGSWALKDILASAKFRVGVAPFPAGPVRRATLATTDGFAIYKRTRYPDAAWELLKFLIGKNYGRAMARAHFLQPARASLVEEWAAYIQSEFPDKAKDMDIAAFADGHIKGYSVVAEIFAEQAAAQQLTYAAWERIFTLGSARVETMAATSAEIERAQTRD
jgi:multiple sugar transport system substrate-binding protein